MQGTKVVIVLVDVLVLAPVTHPLREVSATHFRGDVPRLLVSHFWS